MPDPRILVGDCRVMLSTLPDASVDSIVTDPPYELTSGKNSKGGFMGKAWDASGVAYDTNLWAECLRVLKPGGHLLAFGGTRTYHRMVCAIEDAGFEIRDSIHWVYGSGMPKNHDIAKAITKAGGDGSEWQGWGSAIKPAHEPITLARKPLDGTLAANVTTHGTGGLNIDATRVGFASEADERESKDKNQHADYGSKTSVSVAHGDFSMVPPANYNPPGRWPANLLLTHAAGCEQVGVQPDTFGGGSKASSGFVAGYAHDGFVGRTVESPVWNCVPDCPVAVMDAQSGIRPGGSYPTQRGKGVATGFGAGQPTDGGARQMGDTGGASRFFTTTQWSDADEVSFLYVAKATKKERNAGLDGPNVHTTVKPVALMRHLVRLVTPPGGTVLDPFLGSGTTAVAATLEGFSWLGCEITDEYVALIEARVAWAAGQRAEVAAVENSEVLDSMTMEQLDLLS